MQDEYVTTFTINKDYKMGNDIQGTARQTLCFNIGLYHRVAAALIPAVHIKGQQDFQYWLEIETMTMGDRRELREAQHPEPQSAVPV